MKQTMVSSLLAAVLLLPSLSAVPAKTDVDCLKVYLTVKGMVSANKSKVLEIVAKKSAESPACVCEIVKAAIVATKAKPDQVAAIAEAAAIVAPDQMDLIYRCALAEAPDAEAQLIAVMKKLNPNFTPPPNPLNPPGPGPDSSPVMPVIPPAIINPPKVTEVNPHAHPPKPHPHPHSADVDQ